jgi:hypothetical protein
MSLPQAHPTPLDAFVYSRHDPDPLESYVVIDDGHACVKRNATRAEKQRSGKGGERGSDI